MFKRARSSIDDPSIEDPHVTTHKNESGNQLRQFLLEKFCLEGLTGSDVATLSWYITQAGGLGVKDLALRPDLASKHGHEHVKLHAGKIYPDSDLSYVNAPMFVKRESRRCSEPIPINMPSTAFKTFLTEEMLDGNSKGAKEIFDRIVGGLANYDEHPVVVQARRENFPRPVRPIALYWDGVLYSKHDSFMGFYVTDILSSQKFLSFLVRTWTALACCFPDLISATLIFGINTEW